MALLPFMELTETWSDGFFYMKQREKYKTGKIAIRYFYFVLELGKRSP
jgi:hypothetical protein